MFLTQLMGASDWKYSTTLTPLFLDFCKPELCSDHARFMLWDPAPLQNQFTAVPLYLCCSIMLCGFCSTFAYKYLDTLSDSELSEYDKLINTPSNDWEIYYWASGELKPLKCFLSPGVYWDISGVFNMPLSVSIPSHIGLNAT